MLGQLPTTLDVNNITYEIRSDYRNILCIISAFNAEELSDTEKLLVCLMRIYVDFQKIPINDYGEAYQKASDFIECQIKADKPGPKIVDWDKDEQMIFTAVNKVACQEVRAVPYMHWWTFLGYFQSIDRDDIWGFVLTIRQKKAKHRKLEKYETEFYNANRSLCDIEKHIDRKKDADKYAADLFKKLLNGEEG